MSFLKVIAGALSFVFIYVVLGAGLTLLLSGLLSLLGLPCALPVHLCGL